MADFYKEIDKVLQREGGYVNDPHDKGGETNFGISKRAFPNVDIKNLTAEKARAIYKDNYWDKIKGDNIESQLIAGEVFDMAVNAGVRTSSKMTQAIIGTLADGVIGSKTLDVLNNVDDEKFVISFKLARVARYTNIANNNPTQRKFLRGWINRALEA